MSKEKQDRERENKEENTKMYSDVKGIRKNWEKEWINRWRISKIKKIKKLNQSPVAKNKQQDRKASEI